jgi:hypothetical protein
MAKFGIFLRMLGYQGKSKEVFFHFLDFNGLAKVVMKGVLVSLEVSFESIALLKFLFMYQRNMEVEIK